uniref:Uncharacterized protein n=1 Tax=Latimeria chalumnae TaxID=7897 RepID=H3AJ45_LATCH
MPANSFFHVFSFYLGGLDVWSITIEERAKHDQQFHSLKPIAGFITGDQARNFFLQSGLPQPILAQIWALADMNNDGKMDQHEFSIAMKLIKLKLQGHQLPPALPPIMKQSPVAIPAASGFDTFVGTGLVPSVYVAPGIGGMAGMPGIAGVAPMASIPVVGMSPPMVSSVPSSGSLPLGRTDLSVSLSQCYPPPKACVTTPFPHTLKIGTLVFFFFLNTIFSSCYGHSLYFPSLSEITLTEPITGNLEKKEMFEWGVPQSSRLKYRQLFNSHDKTMSGHLTGPQARTILMQSSLPQAQLATIWNLSDIDQDGKLTAEEFILAMHLIDVAMSGQPLPPVLPSDFIPPSFSSTVSLHCTVPINHKAVFAVGTSGLYPHKDNTWSPPRPKPKITFEDKKRENFERGNLELEKRRQALLEQQRKEQERLAQLERAEQERKERERQEQERKRQLELEKQLEKQRELERQREEERRKEIERREAAKRELERQRQLEWERNRRQELLNQRNKEQEDIVVLKARKKTLEFELEALNDKKHQLEGKLQDIRFRLSSQRHEIESTNKTRELRIAEITHLQQQLQESQQMLGRLIPEKQALNDQLKQVQQNSLHSNSLMRLIYKECVLTGDSLLTHLREQLDEVEKETRSKLQEIDVFNNQLK